MIGLVIATVIVVGVIGGVALSVRSGDLVSVDVVGDQLVVTPKGLNRMWSMRDHVRVPLASVEAVRVVSDPRKLKIGLRMPGTAVPGIAIEGTFYAGHRRSFWAVGHGRPAVEIDLRQASWDRIVVQVADPQALADYLGRAISPAP